MPQIIQCPKVANENNPNPKDAFRFQMLPMTSHK